MMSADSPVSSAPFVVMSFNICNPVAILKDEGLAARFSVTSRMSRIALLIQEQGPDIIGLQEVRDEITDRGRISAVAALMRHLGPAGYRFIIEPNNPSDLSFYNVIAYQASRVVHVAQERFWATNVNPQQFSDPWGNGFGRVIGQSTFLRRREPVATQWGNQQGAPDLNSLLAPLVSGSASFKDLGTIANALLPDLWQLAVENQCRLVHFAEQEDCARVIGYRINEVFPDLQEMDIASRNPKVQWCGTRNVDRLFVHQNDGGRVVQQISEPDSDTRVSGEVEGRAPAAASDNDVYPTPITLLNLHNGLGIGISHPGEKKFSNQLVAKRVNELTGARHVFVVGDFNSFPDQGGPQELAELTKKGFTELTTPIKAHNGIPLKNGTFVCYSYDRMAKQMPEGEFGSQLGHIFYRALGEGVAMFSNETYALAKTGDPQIDSKKAQSEADLVGDRDQHASDHLALVTKATLST